jgi:hypothetical protein
MRFDRGADSAREGAPNGPEASRNPQWAAPSSASCLRSTFRPEFTPNRRSIMFAKCKITISQGAESADIILTQLESAAVAQGITFCGKVASKSGNMGQGRWLLEVSTFELKIVDADGAGVGIGGGGMDYGDLAPLEPVAILSRAVMTPQGVEALGGSARGWLFSGFAIDVRLGKGVVSWGLTGVGQNGDSGWRRPTRYP